MAIQKSWSFMAFLKEQKAKKVFTAPFVSKKTGEPFKSLVCKKTADRDEKGTLVNLCKDLKDITDAEIIAQKDTLRIVQIDVEPEVLERRKQEGRQLESYILCKQGEDSWNDLSAGLGLE